MTKTKKNAVNVKNSNVIANVKNVVTNNSATSANEQINEVVDEVLNEKENKEDSSSVLPLVDSSVLVNEIESGEKESAKKKECMDLIINHFRAPVPSGLSLYGRFFREGCPCDNDSVKKLFNDSGLALDSDDSTVANWVLSLDAPSVGAFTRAANAWWRVAGDFVDSALDDVIDFANKQTSLSNDVYFCELKREWFFVDGSFVIFSASNNDGKKMMFAPGCYYQIAEYSTANYIRAIRSIGVFLDSKRREMRGKVSNVFALAPAVSEYLYRVLSAGYLDSNDITTIAKDVEKRIENEAANEKAKYLQKFEAAEFAINEYVRELDDLNKSLAAAGLSSAKKKKITAKIGKVEQKLSGSRTLLRVAQKQLDELAK